MLNCIRDKLIDDETKRSCLIHAHWNAVGLAFDRNWMTACQRGFEIIAQFAKKLLAVHQCLLITSPQPSMHASHHFDLLNCLIQDSPRPRVIDGERLQADQGRNGRKVVSDTMHQLRKQQRLSYLRPLQGRMQSVMVVRDGEYADGSEDREDLDLD